MPIPERSLSDPRAWVDVGEALLDRLGGLLGPLGGLLGSLGGLLGRLESILGRLGEPLGRSWAPLGPFWEPFLGRFGVAFGPRTAWWGRKKSPMPTKEIEGKTRVGGVFAHFGTKM